MKIVIIGTTRGVGKALLETALEDNYDGTVLAILGGWFTTKLMGFSRRKPIPATSTKAPGGPDLCFSLGMCNFKSLAHWGYSVPFVQRFQVFEMPLLGDGRIPAFRWSRMHGGSNAA